ncbi:hypothetical protein A9168_01605 [Macellibacteroides sp. HH-ZS]|nr:hypothetical protein A9168_01605 [Macellibacteroides sp. HH-ZS]
MKLYIPTSNLNLDNILQSECLLPMSHYTQRCSGFKSFEAIEELRPYKSIVLFKDPIEFSINDTGRYNFPVLIEFEDDNQTSDFHNDEIQDGVFLCKHPLNITPYNSRIYFFSKQAHDLTIVNTQSNKAIKYYNEYKIYPSTEMLQLTPMPKLLFNDSTEVDVYEDTESDKIKGSIYAYLLGQKSSVSHELAKQIRLSQELYNVLTSLISNPSTISAYYRKLHDLLESFKEVDSAEVTSKSLFDSNFNAELGRFRFLKGCLIEFLEKFGCWEMVFTSMCQRWECSFLPNVSTLKSESDFSKLRATIESRTYNAVSKYQASTKEPNLDCIFVQGGSVKIGNAPLINIVLNLIIEKRITPEKLLANRIETYMEVMNGGILSILKNKIGENNWQGSDEQRYVNSLYALLKDPGIPFNLKGIDNIELVSIAAFILRGHSFKDCMTYLKMSEIEDYRYVLTLWGCLCGYQEMNRDALKDVISYNTFNLVYKTLYGQEISHISPINTKIKESTSFDEKEFRFLLDVLKFKETKLLLKCIATKPNWKDIPIEKVLESILNEKPFKRATNQCDLARKAMNLYLCPKVLSNMQSKLESLTLSKTIQKKILEYYDLSAKPNTKTKVKIDSTPNLFPDNNVASIYLQKLPRIHVFLALPEKVQRRLEENWEYTEKKYQNNRLDHIRFFLNLCKKEGRDQAAKPTPLTGVFTEDIAAQADKELNEYYHV